jgi:hypothetical protein
VTAVAREEGQGSKGADYAGERKYLTEHSLMSLWEEGDGNQVNAMEGNIGKSPSTM